MDNFMSDLFRFLGGFLNVSLLLVIIIVILIVRQARKKRLKNEEEDYLNHKENHPKK
ncbi:hypothetical protein [Fictibacillus barbaricus]|uniref:DUF4083 domain-containing protein n=1 Tax=Fictibacillus barbaricus TaxID=182136 RepID=A0ABS2ZC31_9BACL|nr:hypothetical protein [Fictibacillus barbaricus]MBN3544295.1 hypothetical protein [Fictibacillus barbaricus]GGB68002.1 hypothetical protein GCM10007199_37700 [Fictibacillus barbaricus]